jgi:hypothetical protein
MKRTVLTYGLISGAILSIMLAATVPFIDRIGFDRGEVIGYTSMVLAFLLIYFGIRSYRDNVRGGSITFGRAFAVGALIVVVASACYVATWQVIYRTAARDYAALYQEHVLAQERARGATAEELVAKQAQMERFAALYENPLFNVAITFVEPLPVGLILALLSAAILRRQEEESVVHAEAAAE